MYVDKYNKAKLKRVGKKSNRVGAAWLFRQDGQEKPEKIAIQTGT